MLFCTSLSPCLYIGEKGRRLGDHFREHLRHVKNNECDVFKPVFKHFSLPGHSSNIAIVYGISPHQGNTESRKNPNRNLSALYLYSHGINEFFYLFIFLFSNNSLLHSIRTHTTTILHFALMKG